MKIVKNVARATTCLASTVFSFSLFFLLLLAMFLQISVGLSPVVDNGVGPWCPQSIVVSKDANDLIAQLLQVDPNKRLKAYEVLSHPFIKNVSQFEREKYLNANFDYFDKFDANYQFQLCMFRLFDKSFSKTKPSHFKRLKIIFDKFSKLNQTNTSNYSYSPNTNNNNNNNNNGNSNNNGKTKFTMYNYNCIFNYNTIENSETKSSDLDSIIHTINNINWNPTHSTNNSTSNSNRGSKDNKNNSDSNSNSINYNTDEKGKDRDTEKVAQLSMHNVPSNGSSHSYTASMSSTASSESEISNSTAYITYKQFKAAMISIKEWQLTDSIVDSFFKDHIDIVQFSDVDIKDCKENESNLSKNSNINNRSNSNNNSNNNNNNNSYRKYTSETSSSDSESKDNISNKNSSKNSNKNTSGNSGNYNYSYKDKLKISNITRKKKENSVKYSENNVVILYKKMLNDIIHKYIVYCDALLYYQCREIDANHSGIIKIDKLKSIIENSYFLNDQKDKIIKKYLCNNETNANLSADLFIDDDIIYEEFLRRLTPNFQSRPQWSI